MITTAEQKFTLPRWIKATFLGWIVGVLLIVLLSSLLDSFDIEGMQFYLGVGMGAGVAFFQWRVLRKFIPLDTRWIWFSVSGMGIPFVIMDFLMPTPGSQKLVISISVCALVTGIIQYFLLKQSSPKSQIWIPANFLGWTLAAFCVLAIDYTMEMRDVIPPLIGAIINLLLILGSGVVLGATTGIVLKRILPSTN